MNTMDDTRARSSLERLEESSRAFCIIGSTSQRKKILTSGSTFFKKVFQKMLIKQLGRCTASIRLPVSVDSRGSKIVRTNDALFATGVDCPAPSGALCNSSDWPVPLQLYHMGLLNLVSQLYVIKESV